MFKRIIFKKVVIKLQLFSKCSNKIDLKSNRNEWKKKVALKQVDIASTIFFPQDKFCKNRQRRTETKEEARNCICES